MTAPTPQPDAERAPEVTAAVHVRGDSGPRAIDRVTDLFEKWAAEEGEHRAAGEYGLAEGLKVAIDDLRVAVHGGPVPESADVPVDRIAQAILPEFDDYRCGDHLDEWWNHDPEEPCQDCAKARSDKATKVAAALRAALLGDHQ